MGFWGRSWAAQEAFQSSQEVPKRPPRDLSEVQEAPKRPQEAPRASQEGPRGSQESPRGSQEAILEPPGRILEPPGRISESPGKILESPSINFAAPGHFCSSSSSVEFSNHSLQASPSLSKPLRATKPPNVQASKPPRASAGCAKRKQSARPLGQGVLNSALHTPAM